MVMKPYSRKARNSRTAPVHFSHPQAPQYYTPIDFSGAAAAAAIAASGPSAAIFNTAPYPPPPPNQSQPPQNAATVAAAVAYFPPHPPPQATYFGYPTDKRTVEAMVRKQIEYYLSEENLIKDVFLRNKMDSEGYVLLNEIASFQRVASLTQDMDTVVSALKESDTIEICDGIKIRPKKEPLRWPFPTSLKLQYLPQPQAPQPPPQPTQPPPQPTQPPPQPTQSPPTHHHQQPQPQTHQHPHHQHQLHQHPHHHHPHQNQPQPSSMLPSNQPQQPNTIASVTADAPLLCDTSCGAPGAENNNNRLSLTYATAVTNKPTAASIVAGATTVTPVVSNAISASVHNHNNNNNSSNNHIVNNGSITANGPAVASNGNNIPNNKHNRGSTQVESEWKEVKSRRRRPGKA